MPSGQAGEGQGQPCCAAAVQLRIRQLVQVAVVVSNTTRLVLHCLMQMCQQGSSAPSAASAAASPLCSRGSFGCRVGHGHVLFCTASHTRQVVQPCLVWCCA